MISEFQLNFDSARETSGAGGSYRLLELTPELDEVFERKSKNALDAVSIRGRSKDDAVLCTTNATYTIRSVQLSNSFLIISAANQHGEVADGLVIKGSVVEVMELVPMVPKLDRLAALLRESTYRGDADDDDDDDDMENGQNDTERPTKRRRFTYDQVRGLIQASDVELHRGLKEKHILQMQGYLQPLPSDRLSTILALILTLIPSHSYTPSKVPIDRLTDELLFDHALPKEVSLQVCSWFGDITDTTWAMDKQAIVKEIGLGLLEKNRHEPKTEREIMAEWRDAVGDTFAEATNIELLSGNYVDTTDQAFSSSRATSSKSFEPRYKYFPASALPVNPAQRFADLFLTKKTSWGREEIAPFLQDVAVDKKERDRLLMKFTRSSTDEDGRIFYSSRAKY